MTLADRARHEPRPEVDDATRVFRAELGERLLALRKQAGHSLRAAGSLAGLSATFISLVERGKTEIATSRLISLADAYGATIADLLAEVHSSGIVELVPASKALRAPHSAGEPQTIYLASPSWRLQPFRMELEPRATLEPVSHAGEEFVHCIKGKFVMAIDGQAYRLAPGDTIILPPHAVHSYNNPHRVTAACVGAVMPPNRTGAYSHPHERAGITSQRA